MSAAALDRFVARAEQRGLDLDVRTFPGGTRTAQQAADALGCAVARIVKSLVFVAVGSPARAGDASGGDGEDRPVLVLVSGANRVDERRLAHRLGAAQVRTATADEARAATGYAIGGTPPFGHDERLPVLCDRDLVVAGGVVWAAAGTPEAVFPIAVDQLVEVTGATVVDVRAEAAGADPAR